VVEEILVEPGAKVPVGTPLALIRETVEPAAADVPAQPVPPASERQARMRRAIAAAVTRSKREIPHYYLSATADLSAALTWLSGANQARPVARRLVPSALFIKAVALAARAFPDFNARWVDGAVAPAPNINVGVVIALREGGLVAPALHDADRSTLDQLMAGLMDLVERARTGALRGSEVIAGGLWEGPSRERTCGSATRRRRGRWIAGIGACRRARGPGGPSVESAVPARVRTRTARARTGSRAGPRGRRRDHECRAPRGERRAAR
jgi:pyruvate/2-oxoglutarate dehydrogenase complex dihydrolipoamide acyltransferase (E2) component